MGYETRGRTKDLVAMIDICVEVEKSFNKKMIKHTFIKKDGCIYILEGNHKISEEVKEKQQFQSIILGEDGSTKDLDVKNGCISFKTEK